MEVLGPGIIQYVNGDQVIASKGNVLYALENDIWQKWCQLPVRFSNRLLSANTLLSRLSRNEIHHLMKVDEFLYCCFAFGKIYLINDNINKVQEIGTIKGSRPLCVCSDGRYIYYGVYSGNAEREPVELWAFSIEKKEWQVYHAFENIRHIHGVFWDEYSSKIWVTTGDLDDESTIWQFDKQGLPHKIATGSQQTRAVTLVFTERAILYGTDAPDEQNYIYRIDRYSQEIEEIQAVGGPVFYGSKVSDRVFFSTVVEPSEVNRTDAVELWGSTGDNNSWELCKEFEKDLLPKKLFQYGQIKFPNGIGDGKSLFFSPYATKMGHKILKFSLKEK